LAYERTSAAENGRAKHKGRANAAPEDGKIPLKLNAMACTCGLAALQQSNGKFSACSYIRATIPAFG
jgi:hypothetical protein